ncbi:hypothetical protein [Yersinia enterocolitica]
MAVLFLFTELNKMGISIPPKLHEVNLKSYQQEVREYFIKKEQKKDDVEVFINNNYVKYINNMPSEDEFGWLANDPRATYWFLCKVNFEGFPFKVKQFSLTGNSLLDDMNYSNKFIPVMHSSRMDQIGTLLVDNMGPEINLKNEIFNASKQWMELNGSKHALKSINGKSVDIISWVLHYFKVNNIVFPGFSHGDSFEEKLAFCYGSFFSWWIWGSKSPAEKELFIGKFKSALSTEKNRIKNKDGKKKSFNIFISEESHDKIRKIADTEGISNARVIEYAVNLAWKEKQK